jgi:hypothetical protein
MLTSVVIAATAAFQALLTHAHTASRCLSGTHASMLSMTASGSCGFGAWGPLLPGLLLRDLLPLLLRPFCRAWGLSLEKQQAQQHHAHDKV